MPSGLAFTYNVKSKTKQQKKKKKVCVQPKKHNKYSFNFLHGLALLKSARVVCYA